MSDVGTNGDRLHCLIGTSDDGNVEFHQFGSDVYRVGKGWVADVHDIPMGMRWECSRSHFDQYRDSVYSWVLSANAPEQARGTRRLPPVVVGLDSETKGE